MKHAHIFSENIVSTSSNSEINDDRNEEKIIMSQPYIQVFFFFSVGD